MSRGGSIIATEVACKVAFENLYSSLASLVTLEGSTAYVVGFSANRNVSPTLSSGAITTTNGLASAVNLIETVALP